jgi:hypothetical protein
MSYMTGFESRVSYTDDLMRGGLTRGCNMYMGHKVTYRIAYCTATVPQLYSDYS